MPAPIIEVANFVVSRLQTAFDNGGVATTVERVYDIPFDLGKFTGLQVKVFGNAYNSNEDATRAENYHRVDISVVVAKRYTDAAGSPPKAWIDELVNLVYSYVFNSFINVESPLILGEYWQVECETSVMCDIDNLRQNKTFWSEVEISFNRLLT